MRSRQRHKSGISRDFTHLSKRSVTLGDLVIARCTLQYRSGDTPDEFVGVYLGDENDLGEWRWRIFRDNRVARLSKSYWSLEIIG